MFYAVLLDISALPPEEYSLNNKFSIDLIGKPSLFINLQLTVFKGIKIRKRNTRGLKTNSEVAFQEQNSTLGSADSPTEKGSRRFVLKTYATILYTLKLAPCRCMQTG